ncbi:MAG TPA: DNA polymerase I [Bacilli bacterium]
MKKIILIDGNSLMFRSFYATFTNQIMQNQQGIYTNAIYGFCLMMEKLREEDYTHIFVAFDAGKQTFRHQEYEAYKGTRKKLPDELLMQIPYIKRYIDILNIKRYESLDYEADDIIASMAMVAQKEGFDEIKIVTGDKDLLQLVSGNIKVCITKKGYTSLDEYNETNFYEKMNIYPHQIPDYKGLVGDTSDNLPGVKGIGDKTAVKLLNQFKTLESIISNVTLISGKTGTLIANDYQSAIQCKHLATLIKDINFDFSIEDTIARDYDHEKLIQFFNELDFASFLGKVENVKKEIKETEYEIINDINYDFSKLDKTYLNIEVFGSNYLKGEFLGLAISDDIHNYFVPKDIALQNSTLINYLKDEKKEKVTFDYKKLYVVLKKHGLDIKNISFDVLLAGYLINPSFASDDLKKLADNFIHTTLNYDDVIYGANTKAKIPSLNDVANHAVNKAEVIKTLQPILESKIQEYQQQELFTIELGLSKVLGDMELSGLKVDKEKLEDVEKKLLLDRDEIAKKIYELAGEEFNINSVKQLGEILFVKLGIPTGKKTKTGYSTNSDVLEKLSDYEICRLVLDYRAITKLISTYIQGLYEVMNDENFVHPLYKQALTVTGRLSSVEPNIQNMPIRTELGQVIREAFVSRFNNGKILSSDYSQIELRVLAHLANDHNMIVMFNDEVDFHTQTAKRIYDVDEVTKEMRRAAKAINFGIIYGMSAWGLSEALHIPAGDAANYIDKYFSTFPEIKNYLDRTIAEAKVNGYTKTIFNRRRYLPELQSSNKALQAFGERTAMNSPIQGSAADIIKKAMVIVAKKMEGLKSKMIAQVHDELLFDCHPDEVEIVKEIVKTSMESAVSLKVPLIVDINWGDNWLKS